MSKNKVLMEDLIEAYLSVYDNINEVKGFGGHVDPNTGKSSGLRSPSQQAHTTYWRNRQQGKDVPDTRRSKFKYGGATTSTTGSHQGEPPEDFAKNQNPDLAMTPAKRMETRATALRARGQGKRANKIDAVRNRPNMQEDYMDEKRLFPGAPDHAHSFPLSDEEKKIAQGLGKYADVLQREIDKVTNKTPTQKSAAKRKPTTDLGKVKIGESYDSYDLVLSYLLDEGYCDSQDSAIKMMTAMSQDWINSIVEEFVDPEHGETPSGRSPMQNIEDKPKNVRKKAIKGFQNQMSKNYGGKWKYVER